MKKLQIEDMWIVTMISLKMKMKMTRSILTDRKFKEGLQTSIKTNHPMT
jgi:hypothetical protein